MAEQAKVFASKACQPEFSPQGMRGGRRGLTPAGCSLAHKCHVLHTHTQQQQHQFLKRREGRERNTMYSFILNKRGGKNILLKP